MSEYDRLKAQKDAIVATEHAAQHAEILDILRRAYSAVPEDRKGKTRCVDFDPAGSTYEFTEHEWSIKARKLLGIQHEPTGI